MSLLRLAGRIAALLAAAPAYFVAYLLLTEGRGGVFTAVGAVSLVVALGATYVAVVADDAGARTVGVSFGGLLAVVAIAVLATSLLAPFVGLGIGVVGLVLLFAGASVADPEAA